MQRPQIRPYFTSTAFSALAADPRLPDVLHSVWQFLCLSAATSRHQNIWRETDSGQSTMTHEGAYDLSRVTNWSFGAPDWKQSAIESSAWLQLETETAYLSMSPLHSLWFLIKKHFNLYFVNCTWSFDLHQAKLVALLLLLLLYILSHILTERRSVPLHLCYTFRRRG